MPYKFVFVWPSKVDCLAILILLAIVFVVSRRHIRSFVETMGGSAEVSGNSLYRATWSPGLSSEAPWIAASICEKKMNKGFKMSSIQSVQVGKEELWKMEFLCSGEVIDRERAMDLRDLVISDDEESKGQKLVFSAKCPHPNLCGWIFKISDFNFSD